MLMQATDQVMNCFHVIHIPDQWLSHQRATESWRCSLKLPNSMKILPSQEIKRLVYTIQKEMVQLGNPHNGCCNVIRQFHATILKLTKLNTRASNEIKWCPYDTNFCSKEKKYLKVLWKNPIVFRSFDKLGGKQIWDSWAIWRSGRISNGATTKDIHPAVTGTSNL